MINWDYYRNLFPATQKHTYFMTASVGPIPTPVLKCINSRYSALSMHGGSIFEENLKIVERCRVGIAKLINADIDDIAFIPNVSFGMNAIAHSMNEKQPMVIPEEEFPSSIIPWINANFDLEFVPDEHDLDKNLVKSLNSKYLSTSLVTSFVQYSSGYKSDLDYLSKNLPTEDSLFIVNATQGIGVFPIDVINLKIDALICACHKWLFCGEGIAFMYLTRELMNKINPAIVGWRSSSFATKFDNEFRYLENARVFEIGWTNMILFSGLEKALEIIADIGIENIANRVSDLMSYLFDGLKKLNIPLLSDYFKKHRSGIVLLGPFEDLEGVFQTLHKKNIIVTKRGNGIRISVHFYNNEKDIDLLLAALKECT